MKATVGKTGLRISSTATKRKDNTAYFVLFPFVLFVSFVVSGTHWGSTGGTGMQWSRKKSERTADGHG